MRKNILLCHIMDSNMQEVGIAKAKTHSQEFQWRKRMWPISKEENVIWRDKKGKSHLFVHVNESTGSITFLNGSRAYIDKCIQCGGPIGMDARNVYDLLKRKTITAIWGIDSSHIILLMIMGIVAIGAIAGIMYLIGQNTKLQEQLNKYLPAPTAKLMMGFAREIVHYVY